MKEKNLPNNNKKAAKVLKTQCATNQNKVQFPDWIKSLPKQFVSFPYTLPTTVSFFALPRMLSVVQRSCSALKNIPGESSKELPVPWISNLQDFSWTHDLTNQASSLVKTYTGNRISMILSSQSWNPKSRCWVWMIPEQR